MNIQDILAKKRDGGSLSKQEIEYFITEYTKGTITDYQAAALVMAIYINGMTEQETTDLTMAMAYSGEVLDLSEFGIVVDKHSTGGIGDKVTLILMPVIASLGVPVAKMSGRGLGYTGGTIDKLESIPGYRTDITIEAFKQNIREVGISLMGQTLNLAPADKKLYALRDTISCTESIPLIASSIMSKKIAAGASKIVLEVTYGSGAFMKQKKQAELLATTMQKIGKLAHKETKCILTSMEQPLGRMVGNSLEVVEAIEALHGKAEADVQEVVEALGATMLELAGKGKNLQKNKQAIRNVMQNGKALQKLVELVDVQGGDSSYIMHPEKFETALYTLEVKSSKLGRVEKLEALTIGKLAMELGAGRRKKEDAIDATVGVEMLKKCGDVVTAGEVLGYVYANDRQKGEKAVEEMKRAYVLEGCV